MLKIYVNDITYYNNNEDHDFILLVDTNSDYINKNDNIIKGCLIKSNRSIGYCDRMNLNYFRPLKDDEEVLFDLYGNGKVRMVGGKLLIQSDNRSDYKDCIVDLTKGEFIQTSVSSYLSNNPLTLELSNKGDSGITLYKRNGLLGDILISTSPIPLNYNTISGCRITSNGGRNGYKTWGSNIFTKVNEHKIKITFGTEIRGSRILVNGSDNNSNDCIVDMKNGTIKEVDLDEYRKQNPIIIKLKNKIC